MRREDVYDVINRLQPSDVTKLVLVLRAGFGVNVDMVYRFEGEYLAMRGREAGTNDEGRAFFIPYTEIVYLKIERLILANDLRRMYGEPTDGPAGESYAEGSDSLTSTPVGALTPPPGGLPDMAMTPAAIAKQNLLDRIRAARTSAGAGVPAAVPPRK